MSAPFRVALSGDFRKPDGAPVYPDFDLEPLRRAPNVEFAYLEPRNPLEAEQLADFDALNSSRAPLHEREHPPEWAARCSCPLRRRIRHGRRGRLHRAGIALAITPDGVRRPVAVSIITLILALTASSWRRKG